MSHTFTRLAAVALLSKSTRRIKPAVCARAYTTTSLAHPTPSTIRLPPSRPHLLRSRPAPPSSRSWPALASGSRRTIFIQTETTPNADALKFLPNHRVLPAEASTPYVEYLSARSTLAPPYPSPLAARLMAVDGVTAVFYGTDFITVTKSADASWAHIRPEIFSLITEAVTSGQQLVTVSARAPSAAGTGTDGAQDRDGAEPGQEQGQDSLSYDANDSEVVGMIKEILETRIRPAIQEDGGDLEFRGFHDGYVSLKLRGACRTCDSSTVTLKNGIEGMLMHYIDEVKGVKQMTDPEEEIAVAEFEKFEQKLREQKGPGAGPSVFGKGAINSVPG